MRLITILVSLAMLSGCASNLRVDENYSFDARSNDGIVVASTRTDDKCRGFANSATLQFEGDSTTKVTKDGFFLENTFLGNDFDNPPGYFQVKKLPAGKYSFTYLHKTGVMEGILSLREYNMSFVVKPGKIQYLGEIHGNIPDCSTIKLKVVDQRKRDRKLFDERMTRLKSSDFEYQILKPRK